MVDKFWWSNNIIVSGYDIGKKGNPSHHSVFAVKDIDNSQCLVQIHQKFLDRCDYIKQIEYIKICIEYFGIQRLYYDNTRGEFEERQLPRECIPIVIGAHDGKKSKSKVKMAVDFAKLVEQKRISLIDDDRFISQITCVTNNLEALETPSGHGDSFISVMLAVAVFEDFYSKNRSQTFGELANLQDLVRDKRIPEQNKGWKNMPISVFPNDENICKICGKRTLEKIENGKVRCMVCMAVY